MPDETITPQNGAAHRMALREEIEKILDDLETDRLEPVKRAAIWEKTFQTITHNQLSTADDLKQLGRLILG